MSNITGSKIGGNFSVLSVTENDNLVFKTGKSDKLIPTGSSHDKWLVLIRPDVCNKMIYPIVHICVNQNFEEGNFIAYNAKNDQTVRSKFFMNDGSNWTNTFLDEELINFHEEATILCDLSDVQFENPYFVRWSWTDENGNNYGWNDVIVTR